MDNSLAHKIEKAHGYAEERERFQFQSFTLKFHGDNHEHVVSYADGHFKCDCEYFAHAHHQGQTHGFCAHTMALEMMLKPMVPERLD